MACSRIYWLVHKGGSKPEIGQVFDRDVLRIRTCFVYLGKPTLCRRSQNRVAQVPIGEGVGAILQPHDDCMELTYGANAGMVDVIVHHIGGYQKA